MTGAAMIGKNAPYQALLSPRESAPPESLLTNRGWSKWLMCANFVTGVKFLAQPQFIQKSTHHNYSNIEA
jgi:hypothetical protein